MTNTNVMKTFTYFSSKSFAVSQFKCKALIRSELTLCMV